MKPCDLFIYIFLYTFIIIKCYDLFIIPKNMKMVKNPIYQNRYTDNKRNALLYAKKKRNRKVVVLECTEARKLGKQPSRYVTEKNKNNTPKKLQLYKYNKYLKRRTLHVEIK
ncbi:apicoplast ribosomal protein L33 precursor, putative [Plasmodium sp. gorilla clade G3]|nr:apicoplast ribosomal protein L33 precursor, putative [Plasmodium sp. gorilla clade G3]